MRANASALPPKEPPVTEPVDAVLPDPVQRRNFLRGGALLAGATAGAVAITAASARPASAADGQTVTVGGDLTGSSTTRLTVNKAGDAVLRLANNAGPALSLPPVGATWDYDLDVGEIASTELGPWVGVEDDEGNSTATFLATDFDLATVPSPIAFPNDRRLDTRTTAGRKNVLATSTGAFDSAGRLKAGAWVDVSVVAEAEDFVLDGAFLNVTSTGSTAGGYLFVYPPGARPVGSTVNFTKGSTIANFSFAGVEVVNDTYAVRVYSNAPSHVVLDLTGYVISAGTGPSAAAAAKKTARSVRRSAARRVQSSLRGSRR